MIEALTPAEAHQKFLSNAARIERVNYFINIFLDAGDAYQRELNDLIAEQNALVELYTTPINTPPVKED